MTSGEFVQKQTALTTPVDHRELMLRLMFQQNQNLMSSVFGSEVRNTNQYI